MGVAAALFFAVTFIVNRLMALNSGSWGWSASLRFYWMLPFFLVIVWYRGGLQELFAVVRKNIVYWLVWSTVGFGLFYAPLTYSAYYSPSWLLASTWQFTIIAGMIVAPFIDMNKARRQHSYRSSAFFSGVILLGIIIMQVRHAQIFTAEYLFKGIVPVLIAAFAYPLGNRKMMQLTEGKLDVFQRILGMVICSMPFWVILNGYELLVWQGFPNKTQYFQTFIVAVFSGVVATTLFFSATERVRSKDKQLAAVEATQSTEVLFALAGEVFILNSSLPDTYGVAGIVLVLTGMMLPSLKS